MADVYRVTALVLNVRSGPSTTYRSLSVLARGSLVNVDSISNNWAHLVDQNGYASMSYLELVSTGTDSPTPTSEDTTSSTLENQANMELTEEARQKQEIDMNTLEEETDENPEGYVPDFPAFAITEGVDSDSSYISNLGDLKVQDCRGIHGMPHQFLPIVDTRIDGTNNISSFGRKYADKIVAKMPLLVMTPGIPVFMRDYNDNAKKSILERVLSNSNSTIDDLITKGGKYYSLKFDYKGYYTYVNLILRNMAKMLDIEDIEINGTQLGQFDWGEGLEADLTKVINYTNGVCFYIDSEKQINESFSNSTTDSTLKGQINGLSDYGRELQFLLGGASSTGVLPSALENFASADNIAASFENIGDFVDNILLGKGNIFSRLTANIGTLVQGGKLIFPEIWTDSSFSRSYSVRMKFISPSPSTISVYLNIMVPMVLLLCLAAPRQCSTNGYNAPYLIKAFYKSMFSVDTGIITGLSFRRGEEGSWTRDGLPTVLEADVEIKDLYSSFSISDNTENSNIFNNTILMDYLANLCGINLNEPDIYRQISYWMTSNAISSARDAVRYDIFRGLEQFKDNAMYSLYDRFFR